MSITIYGLRRKGAGLFRYIGKTRSGAEFRLSRHIYEAASKATPFALWLREHKGDIEAVKIAFTDDALSNEVEAALIRHFADKRHPLFNVIHVPKPNHERADA